MASGVIDIERDGIPHKRRKHETKIANKFAYIKKKQ